MFITLIALSMLQDFDIKPTAPPQLVAPSAKYQLPIAKTGAGPLVVSAIRTYDPIILVIRDPYKCRDIEIETTIPTDKVHWATRPDGVRISAHGGLFGTKTTFDFGGFKRTVHVHKNGKVVIE